MSFDAFKSGYKSVEYPSPSSHKKNLKKLLMRAKRQQYADKYELAVKSLRTPVGQVYLNDYMCASSQDAALRIIEEWIFHLAVSQQAEQAQWRKELAWTHKAKALAKDQQDRAWTWTLVAVWTLAQAKQVQRTQQAQNQRNEPPLKVLHRLVFGCF